MARGTAGDVCSQARAVNRRVPAPFSNLRFGSFAGQRQRARENSAAAARRLGAVCQIEGIALCPRYAKSATDALAMSFRFESDSPFGPGVRDDNAAWSAFWSREPDQVCSSACACAIRCLSLWYSCAMHVRYSRAYDTGVRAVLTRRMVLECYVMSGTDRASGSEVLCDVRPTRVLRNVWS
eukprot:1727865-Rhodomonas_salina.2